MSARITAAEAAAILRDLARGREDGNGGDVWPLYDRAEDAMAAVIGLAAESDAHRTRADAAEADRDALRAECERLRSLADAHGAVEAMRAIRDELGLPPDATYTETVDAVREWLAMLNRKIDSDAACLESTTADYCDAYRTGERALTLGLAECERLRAIVEGRTVAPTDAEIDAHWRAGGAWLVSGSVVTGAYEVRRLASLGIAHLTWVPLSGTLHGRTPCAWPVTP